MKPDTPWKTYRQSLLGRCKRCGKRSEGQYCPQCGTRFWEWLRDLDRRIWGFEQTDIFRKEEEKNENQSTQNERR